MISEQHGTEPWRLGAPHSHGDLGELLPGQVQRVVDGGDAVMIQGGVSGQRGPQDGVVGHIHEGDHGVPALVVVPHLQSGVRNIGSGFCHISMIS